MLPILLGIGLALPSDVFAKERIRTVELKKDEIVTVNTALTVATIVQVPDRPLSVVVGDSEAFKVEYLDQAITIKPLSSSARSNLYIYTDYRRFDVALVTGSERSADYVVYLKPKVIPPKKPEVITWIKVERSFLAEGLLISVRRVAKTKGFALIEFGLSSKQRVPIDPASFWLTASSRTIPIENLTLPALEIDKGRIVSGLIEMRLEQLSLENSLRFEYRGKKANGVNLPRLKDWK